MVLIFPVMQIFAGEHAHWPKAEQLKTQKLACSTLLVSPVVSGNILQTNIFGTQHRDSVSCMMYQP